LEEEQGGRRKKFTSSENSEKAGRLGTEEGRGRRLVFVQEEKQGGARRGSVSETAF